MDEAQPLFGDDYFVQSPLSEPHTPYYFTKVRKSSTRFEGHEESGLDIHHGIAIDIFPLDRVPRSRFIERLQHRCVRLLTNSFVATTQPLPEGGLIQRALVHTFARVVDKRLIYRLLIWAQTLAKRHDTEFVSIVNMPRDHIRRSTLHPPQLMPFGGIEVKAPRDLRSYLEWHYPNLHRDVAPEEQINHAPHRLNFNGED